MNAGTWAAYADASAAHRDPHDPDVEIVIHVVCEEIEMDQLEQQGRLAPW